MISGFCLLNSALLLGFVFESPWMLCALALTAIPVVLHFLEHRQPVRRPWAAMSFLTAAIERQKRSLQWERWLRLLVRVAILALPALALARPVWQGETGPRMASTATQHVLVIDATASLQTKAETESRFEQLIRKAIQRIQDAPDEDLYQLVTISRRPGPVIIRKPVRASAMIRELRRLQPTDDHCPPRQALEQVLTLIDQPGGLPRRQVEILTDLQATTWFSDDAGTLRQTLLRISDRSALRWITTEETEIANIGIVDAGFRERHLFAGQPASCQVTLKRAGPHSPIETLVTLMVDDKPYESRRGELTDSQPVTVTFEPVFSGVGDHKIEFRIGDDAVPFDNHFYLVAPVRESLRVLLVDGRPSSRRLGGAADFFQLALNPRQALSEEADASRSSPVTTTLLRDGSLLNTPLDAWDAVVLCDVPRLTDAEAASLETFCAAGGGVIVCLGPQVEVDRYNAVLYRDGVGLLPARLEAVTGDGTGKSTLYEFDPLGFRHPIVKPFQGNPGAGLEATRTFAYIKAKSDSLHGAGTALAFQTGDPAIVTKPFGRGGVVLVTTSVDREWGTWAVFGHSLVPLAHEMLAWVIKEGWRSRLATVGEPLHRLFTPTRSSSEPTPALWTGPDGHRQTIEGQSVAVESSSPLTPRASPHSPVAGSQDLWSIPTTMAGIGQLSWSTSSDEQCLFAVNVDRAESLLAPLSREQMKKDLVEENAGPMALAERNPETMPRRSPASVPSSLTTSLLAAAFCLLLMDLVIPLRGRTGLAAVVILLAGAAVVPLIPVHAGRGWFVTTLAAILTGIVLGPPLVRRLRSVFLRVVSLTSR